MFFPNPLQPIPPLHINAKDVQTSQCNSSVQSLILLTGTFLNDTVVLARECWQHSCCVITFLKMEDFHFPKMDPCRYPLFNPKVSKMTFIFSFVLCCTQLSWVGGWTEAGSLCTVSTQVQLVVHDSYLVFAKYCLLRKFSELYIL